MDKEFFKKELKQLTKGIPKQEPSENKVVQLAHKDIQTFFKSMVRSETLFDKNDDWQPKKLNIWGEVIKPIKIIE
ncbi:unnamed protein product [marine sediment metagenome]|uniref:Uncharacterized protein n=1 Tax=marine sediment metagenome TaxID=412755 RepID=X1A3Q9_9ZZZZ